MPLASRARVYADVNSHRYDQNQHSVLTKPLRGGLLDLTIFFSKASLKGWIGNIIEYQRVSKENFAIFGHFWPFSAPKMAEIRIVWF